MKSTSKNLFFCLSSPSALIGDPVLTMDSRVRGNDNRCRSVVFGCSLKILRMALIVIAVGIFGACLPACGGGGGGSSDTPTDLPSDTGGGGGGGDAVADDPIANALARIAINAALKIGLGLSTDDELFNRAHVQPYLFACGSFGCNFFDGETAVNCPSDCTCGDGWCDLSESAVACPADCRCENESCDVYAGESSLTCGVDCHPECGDAVCSHEEFFTSSCTADCSYFNDFYIGSGTLPVVRGIPTYKCVGSENMTTGTIYKVEGSEVEGTGICGYGFRKDDTGMTDVTAFFIDFAFGIQDVPINGLTFACSETMYTGDCLEGMALLVFNPDGTLTFHTALAGKVYAYREDPPEAYTIVGAAASGTITLPPSEAHQTCVGFGTWPFGACAEYYRYGDVAVTYDADGDGINDYDVAYLETDGSVTAPAHEICQSFAVDWTKIRPDYWFGDNDPAAIFYDEDGNGLAACDDPACADHPLCQMTYCSDEGIAQEYNYHGWLANAACPACGDGTCSADENLADSCGVDCPCGDGVCDSIMDAMRCPQDCPKYTCGDDTCEGVHETAVSCPDDCFCGDTICDATETFALCPEDCVCGDSVCEEVEGFSRPPRYCAQDCCNDGICNFNERGNYLCSDDCGVCGNGVCEIDKGEGALLCGSDCKCVDTLCDVEESGAWQVYCAADCCGNGTCDPNEIDHWDLYCAADCCVDDGVLSCDPIEIDPLHPELYCAADCCGNDTCDVHETNAICPADCP